MFNHPVLSQLGFIFFLKKNWELCHLYHSPFLLPVKKVERKYFYFNAMLDLYSAILSKRVVTFIICLHNFCRRTGIFLLTPDQRDTGGEVNLLDYVPSYLA